ncbi:hypothetical protein PoB_000728000 [Plakobranchus ocellatus]|uniref:Uncharacterized protein n=1 Tax=Plakobranchus ocellatus TaxID=259542 RepID=A0AAV3YDJ9_9GAST|nr:hypothetical protein PoB_000728000 [Plakobranchus ocellatus]
MAIAMSLMAAHLELEVQLDFKNQVRHTNLTQWLWAIKGQDHGVGLNFVLTLMHRHSTPASSRLSNTEDYDYELLPFPSLVA